MALTTLLLVLVLFAFMVMNPPQCPLNYTQEQVDASNCIVGANIGLGLFIAFIILPFALVVIGLWAIYLGKDKIKEQLKKTKE